MQPTPRRNQLTKQVDVRFRPPCPDHRPVPQPAAHRGENLESPPVLVDISNGHESHNRRLSDCLGRVVHRGIHDGESPMRHLGRDFGRLEGWLILVVVSVWRAISHSSKLDWMGSSTVRSLEDGYVVETDRLRERAQSPLGVPKEVLLDGRFPSELHKVPIPFCDALRLIDGDKSDGLSVSCPLVLQPALQLGVDASRPKDDDNINCQQSAVFLNHVSHATHSQTR